MSATRTRYRRVVTSMHDDEWFSQLTPGARNLYLNLIPYVGTCGAQRASVGKLAKLAGFENSLIPMFVAKIITKRHLRQLGDKVVYWKGDEIVWVKNFTKIQGSGQKFISGAIKHAGNFPASIAEQIARHIDPDSEKNKKTTELTETVAATQKTAGEYTLYDAPSDTVTDTHGRAGARMGGQDRVTELQSNRDTEVSRKSVSPHVRARVFVLNYLDKCPSGIAINSEIKHDWMLTLIDKALDAESPEWWGKVFEKAEASDFLSGRVPGGKGEFFELKFGWLVQHDIAKRILAGDYDKFQSKKSDRNRISRDPTAEWNQREIANA